MAKAARKKQTIDHKLGDEHTIDGIACVIKYVNAGKGWLFPIQDTEGKGGRNHIRCLAYAKVDECGAITVL